VTQDGVDSEEVTKQTKLYFSCYLIIAKLYPNISHMTRLTVDFHFKTLAKHNNHAH